MSVASQLDVTVASSIYGMDLCGNFFTIALQGCGIIVNTDILAFKFFFDLIYFVSCSGSI